MTQRTGLRSALAFSCMAALLMATSGTALAAGHGGGGGGGHFGGGGGHFAGGGYGHGGYGGYHGGYGGYRGGYGGYRGYGYGGYRGYGGWGWGWGGVGLGLGLYFATLPLYYSTLWWEGVPYYYADNTYYTYDTNVGQYETVAPPPGLAAQTVAPATGDELMAYPKNGQTDEQQSKDKYECHRWAATQSGFDPAQSTGASATANQRSDYLRAEAACLEGRGYSVK